MTSWISHPKEDLIMKNHQAPNKERALFDVLPAAVVSLLEDVRSALQKKHRWVPLLLIAALIWFTFAAAAAYVDWQLLFESRKITLLDVLTGKLPTADWWIVAIVAAQGIMAIAGIKLFLNTPRRRASMAVTITILGIVFVVCLNIVVATGELPRYLSLVFAQAQGFTFGGPAAQQLKGLAQYETLYSLAVYGTYLPYVIVPLASALFAAHGTENVKAAYIASRDMSSFRSSQATIQQNVDLAEESRYVTRQMDNNPKLYIIPKAQKRFTAISERLDTLTGMILSGKLFSNSEELRVFADVMGRSLPEYGNGAFAQVLNDPEAALEFVRVARETMDDGYLDKMYDKWSAARGIEGFA